MNLPEKARETFTTGGFNCSQAVFSTYSTQLGLDEETAKKVACGFGGGIGHTGETCGAVTGAIMTISLKYGQTDPSDAAAKEKTFAIAQEFMKRFSSEMGSLKCKDLLGYDMSNPEEYKELREKGITKQVCPKYIETASRILEELL
ncbi:MAG: C-GCAxxG-C-C family protein [Syntrophothermus sp.]